MGIVKDWSVWWKKWGWYFLFFLVFVLVIYLIYSGERKYNGKYSKVDNALILAALSKKKKINQKKHETQCRTVFEKLYNKPFNSVRPNFLKYENRRNLELDGYNRELNITRATAGGCSSTCSPRRRL